MPKKVTFDKTKDVFYQAGYYATLFNAGMLIEAEFSALLNEINCSYSIKDDTLHIQVPTMVLEGTTLSFADKNLVNVSEGETLYLHAQLEAGELEITEVARRSTDDSTH